MRSIVLACLFSGLSVCLGVAHSGEQKVPPTPPANSESNWRENSKLTLEQKKLLEALSAETLYRGQAFGAVVWDKAGSVLNLSLDASSRLGAGSPSQQVVSFLSTYGALWHINKADLRNRLLVVDQQTRGECSSVTLQLQEKGQRVFNATLHFSLTSKGRVRSVTGFMDARPTSFEVGKATLSRAEAMHALLKQMSWPDEAATFYRNPVLVQLDPYFLSGEAHRPVQAYLFATDQGPNGGFVITTPRH